MLHNKRSDAEAANIPVREANLLLQQYAQFLIVSVIELWLVEAANSRDLQIKLQKPGQDLWQYLRSHVNAIVQAVPCNWHVNADDIVHRIACRMLSSRIGILLEAVQPWEIVLKR